MRSSSHLKRRQLLFPNCKSRIYNRSTLAGQWQSLLLLEREETTSQSVDCKFFNWRQESKVQSKAVPGRQGEMGGLKTACRIRSCFKTEKQPTWRKWWILSIPHCIVPRLATSLHLNLLTFPIKLEMSIISPPTNKIIIKTLFADTFLRNLFNKDKIGHNPATLAGRVKQWLIGGLFAVDV